MKAKRAAIVVCTAIVVIALIIIYRLLPSSRSAQSAKLNPPIAAPPHAVWDLTTEPANDPPFPTPPPLHNCAPGARTMSNC
jgi:hypothetical protein